ncbi:diablo IAP-binding mitochondrial protein-like [Mytilus galloprovincialis]|uniref:diablo IAP-binding mitochondrial protein-like n=1 Tax=Mytilus galloprovincialis TaxID=29158 RepID=UPI003F7B7071
MTSRLVSSFKKINWTYSAVTHFLRQTKQLSDLSISKRCKISNFQRKFDVKTAAGAGTGISLCLLGVKKASCQTTDNITAPDPSTLLSETLVRNASFAVVESTTAFLSQVTVSLVESCEQYTKALYILMKLMDYRLKVLGNGESEQKIADLIIEARASVNKLKSRNQELQLLYMSAYNLVNEASTAAYTAGSEFHSTVATSMIQSSEVHLSKFQRDLNDAEAEMRKMEANVILVESEYMEKKIKAHENRDVENDDLLNIETHNGETNSEDNFQHDGSFDSEKNENET